MADKRISSSNRGFDPISSSSKLGKETVENIGNGDPLPPTLRSKESEQKILNRQQAIRSSPPQTQTSFAATPLLQTSAPVESAEPISNEIKFPLISVLVKFVGNGHIEIFDNVSDLNQLRSDIKQRYGIEEEFFLMSAGKPINDMAQLHNAWPGCEGMFHMVLPLKTPPSQQSDSKVHMDMTTWTTQTQTSFAATPLLQTSAPVKSAEPISNEIKFPLISALVKFVGNGHIEIFDNVSDLNQLRSEIKQRYGIKEEFFVIGAGKPINDTSQLQNAWPGCEGMFHMVVSNKT